MKKKAFIVYKKLLENPNEWFVLADLGREADLTCRQVFAFINAMPQLPITKSIMPGNSAKFKFEGTPEEGLRIERDILCEMYNIKEDEQQLIRDCLTMVAWCSAWDISIETGIPYVRVTHIATTLGDVEMSVKGKVRAYRKIEV